MVLLSESYMLTQKVEYHSYQLSEDKPILGVENFLIKLTISSERIHT